MAVKILTCEMLSGLDNGLFGAVVDRELRRLVDDLEDRGHDGNKRTLIIQIDFSMDPSRDPTSCGVAIDPRVQAKLPPLRSGVTVGKVAAVPGGELGMLFRDDNADSPDQGTIYDAAADIDNN